VVEELPVLEAGSKMRYGAGVVAFLVPVEEFEGFKVVSPDAEGACANGAAAKVMTGVSGAG